MALTQRSNDERAHIVDKGVSLDAEKGTVVAWAYMLKHGVSEDVIMRVLSTPSSRRPRPGHDNGDAGGDHVVDGTGGLSEPPQAL